MVIQAISENIVDSRAAFAFAVSKYEASLSIVPSILLRDVAWHGRSAGNFRSN
jgi:hypothetical protein